MTTNNPKNKSIASSQSFMYIQYISQIMGNAQHNCGVNNSFAKDILMICGASATC